MIVLQFILILFLLFALSRVFLRFRSGQIKPTEFLFWSVLFAISIIIVFFPNETTKIASFFGIGRGADFVIYAAIASLFYLLFRAYVMMEDIRHEITELVRALALKDIKVKRKSKRK